MAKKSKTEATNIRVPQSDDEAAAFVTEIGRHKTEIERIEANLKDDVAALKAKALEEALPAVAAWKAALAGLRTYCEANRARLTRNFTTKTHAFPTGKVSWRARKPKVSLRGKVEDIIDRIKTLGLLQFIRQEEAVNKQAMLDDPTLAKTITGVSIGSAGEDFYVGDEPGDDLVENAEAAAESEVA